MDMLHVYGNFSKAFDYVNYNILPLKVQLNIVNGSLLQGFESFIQW